MDETTQEPLMRAQEILGHEFSDLELLERAFRHASVADTRLDSNERLEFLGDAVLGLLTCEMIFRLFPDLLEGEMTKIKSAVVSRQTCAIIALELGLDDLIDIGKGMQVHGQLPQSLSAAILESVTGALYVDGGFEAVRRFLEPILEPIIVQNRESGHQENFKSVLQQHAQQYLPYTPVYLVLDEQGPDHAKCFEVCVEIGVDRYPSCWGQSKKQAEQAAALEALRELGLAEVDNNGVVKVLPLDEGYHGA